MNRTKNSIFNIVSTVFGNVTSLIISFLSRVIFLKILNQTYLGVSGLFSNILLIFSFVELGLGAALTQMFYKPFQEKDYKQLSIVTHTTRVLLNIVGIVIIILTICFTPILNLFVNDMDAVPNMQLIFFLYGINSAVTYFLGYYRTVITANQEAYRLVKIDFAFNIIKFIAQSIMLIITRNFVVYLITQIIVAICQNLVIRRYVRKKYNYIDYGCKKFFKKEEGINLLKNISALSLDRIALIVTNGTDNILISKFLNLGIVGLASNYVMITQSVSTLVEALFGPLLASIGNLCVTESKEKKYIMFNNLSFLQFWIYGFCSITAFILSDTFISIVFGNSYIIPKIALFFLCFDIFCSGMTRVPMLFRTAEGLFWYGKFRPLVQSLLNLCISLILVSITHDLWAVYAGTVVSRLLVSVWYTPHIVLKYSMNKKSGKYYLNLLKNFITYLFTVLIMLVISNLITFNGILKLLVLGLSCVFFINIIFLLTNFCSKELKYWVKFIIDNSKKINN